MFIGEGPGRDEDLQGSLSWDGRGNCSPISLRKDGTQARGRLYRQCGEVSAAGKSQSEPDEVASCEPFSKKQIDLVRPEIVIALGKFASRHCCRARFHYKTAGQLVYYYGIKLMPTFHPAYLLRNPGDKKLVWEDIKKVIKR